MDEITDQNQPVSYSLSLTCWSRITGPGQRRRATRGDPAFLAFFSYGGSRGNPGKG
jgi:hypothetical protein